MNIFPLKPFQWVNHGISKVSVIYPLVLVSFHLKIQWVVPWVFNGTASHSVKSAVVDLVVLEPVKLLVFGMHTQSPKSFYRDVTNKKRNLILCCSTTPEII